MNFLAHGFRHTDDPWRCAGTALPDWARVLGGRVPPEAAAAVGDAGDDVRSLARGVLRHHDDDRVFHASEAFAAAQRAAQAVLVPIRRERPRFRVRFGAHVLVEMLLDAALAEEDAGRLDAYYGALEQVDADRLAAIARPWSGCDPESLAGLVRAFRRSRFLAEYADDRRVTFRLGQVCVRVGVDPPEDALLPYLPELRDLVRARATALVAPAIRPGSGESLLPPGAQTL